MTTWTAFRICIVLPLAAVLLQGADDPEPGRYYASGYLAAGFGRCQHGVTNVSIAGGGDGFLWRGLTLGGDVGAYAFTDSGRYRFGLATLNVGYSFGNRNRRGRFEPFVNAGVVGLAFGPGVAQAAAAGGGLHYWFKPRVGLRTEFRFVGIADEVLTIFRIGVSFR
jgi:hypothetical protein